MVYQVMRREIVEGKRGAMVSRDVYLLMGGVDLNSIYSALKALRTAGLVRFVSGSSRWMEISDGAPDAIFDQRGRNDSSRANLKRNTRASMATPRGVKGRAFATDW